MTHRIDRIRAILVQSFSPSELEVIDDSARHAGHAGAAPEGETHFKVKIAADSFAGKSRIAMHRAITDALSDEFESGLHALSITCYPPRQAPE